MKENGIHNTEQGEAEATLRLIARLPAPAGLAERVQKGLHAAPKDARVLAWPDGTEGSRGWLHGWARGAAAAALVCVVAGGALQIGQISSRMAPAGNGRAAAVRIRPAGGFSSAGAMRTPETLNGPVLKQATKKAEDAKKKDAAKKAAETGPR